MSHPAFLHRTARERLESLSARHSASFLNSSFHFSTHTRPAMLSCRPCCHTLPGHLSSVLHSRKRQKSCIEFGRYVQTCWRPYYRPSHLPTSAHLTLSLSGIVPRHCISSSQSPRMSNALHNAYHRYYPAICLKNAGALTDNILRHQ